MTFQRRPRALPIRAASASAALLAALLAAPEARAQICIGLNCAPQGSGSGNAGANGAGQGGARGTVVWDPLSGKWVPQVNLEGQAGANAGAGAQGQVSQAGPAPGPPPRRAGRRRRALTFKHHLALGGCAGFQMGIADPEPRLLTCIRARWQPSRYLGVGLDLTYSLGEDDAGIPPALHVYRHELAAWPNLTLHAGYFGGFSPYLRVGPTAAMAPSESPYWSGTRTYLGYHFGVGFHIGLARHVAMDIEHLGFRLDRLDDLPYPDGAVTPGGWGMQMRMSVSFTLPL